MSIETLLNNNGSFSPSGCGDYSGGGLISPEVRLFDRDNGKELFFPLGAERVVVCDANPPPARCRMERSDEY